MRKTKLKWLVLSLAIAALSVSVAVTIPEPRSGTGRDRGEDEISAGRQKVSPVAIHLEKYVNGQDADEPPGPEIPVGEPVLWEYMVTNTGRVPLTGVQVTDDDPNIMVECPADSLEPGESMTCEAVGTATEGSYSNLGTAEGTAPDGTVVQDSDPSHYVGYIQGESDQGCSQGYWKNHLEAWGATGYTPSQEVLDVFDVPTELVDAVGSATLLEALRFKGGNDLEGGARILLRQAVTALLNAAHPDVSYPRTGMGVVSTVNDALVSGDRETMLDLASDLDRDNNLGCPLS